MNSSAAQLLFQIWIVAVLSIFAQVVLADFEIAKKPSWIEPVSFESCRFSATDLVDGTCRLLSDVQIRADEKTQREFRHYATEVINQQGLESESEIEIEYAPAYETVLLHYVRIWRSGRSFDRLVQKNISEIRREAGLEIRMLDGAQTLHIIVDDVRPGDILEYAFTVEGANAVLGGQFFTTQWIGWSVPVQKVLCRVVTPRDFFVQYKTFHTNRKPVVSDGSDGLRTYRLLLEMVKATAVEADLPVWFDPVPRIQFSSARSWGETAEWGRRLYPGNEQVSSGLQKEIDRISMLSSDPGVRAGTILRFVQDEIRYLGIEIGAGSYVPTPPTEVFERRFGDCKDKTNLLITMLGALGIKAYPVLVNLDLLEHVAEMLPSAGAFNHVIAAVELDGQTYFADPTSRSVPGAFKELVQPDFGMGLALREGTAGLSKIPRRSLNAPTKTIEERFDLFGGPGFPATLSVKTVYIDEEADLIKESIAQQSRDALVDELMKFYQTDYPDINATAPPSIVVDHVVNRVVIEEWYQIPDFWIETPGQKALEGRIFPRDIYGFTASPLDIHRTMPLAVPFPIYMTQHTRVRLPPGMSMTERSVRDGDVAFEYMHDVQKKKDGYLISHTFRTLSDHVSAQVASAHQRKRAQIGKSMGYTLTTVPKNRTQGMSLRASLFPWYALLLVMAVLSVVVGIYVTLHIYRFDPVPIMTAAEGVSPQNFGPWLSLLGLSLLILPILGMYYLVGLRTAFLPDTLFSYLSGDSVPNSLLWMVTVLGKVGHHLLSLLFSALLILLYFRRRQIFPKVFIWTSAVRFVLFVIDIVLSRLILGPEHYKFDFLSIFSMTFYTALWCLYVGFSTRVRTVFTRRRLVVEK